MKSWVSERTVRVLVIVAACWATISCGRDAEVSKAEPIRILFVGNSLTYVGNLPAVVDELSRANGRATSSDMIVTGGATLTDRVEDGSVAAALATRKYAYVVLQERGGDFSCGFGPESCENARASLAALASIAKDHGAEPLLLGTYRGLDDAWHSIESAESLAAWNVGADYIGVSERLRELHSRHPEMTWFAEDDRHPGADLTLMEAILLYERIHGAKPSTSAFVVSAPIYTYTLPVSPELRAAAAPSEEASLPTSASYEADRIGAVLEGLR